VRRFTVHVLDHPFLSFADIAFSVALFNFFPCEIHLLAHFTTLQLCGNDGLSLLSPVGCGG
jgi:hypothetical protein